MNWYRAFLLALLAVCAQRLSAQASKTSSAALRPELVVQMGHTAWVNAVAFSPDGRLLASGGADSTVKFWGTENGLQLRTLSGHTDQVAAVQFSPNSRLLASGSWDHTVKLWDVTSGRELRSLSGHRNIVNTVAFSPDGERLLSLGGDLKIWNVQTGVAIRTITLRDFAGTAAWSGDGRFIAIGDARGRITLWDANTGAKFREIHASPKPLGSVAFSSDSRGIVSAGYDVKLWNISDGREIRTFGEHRAWVNRLAVSADGRFLVSGSNDQTATIWDFATAANLHTLPCQGAPIDCSVAFSHDGQWVVSGTRVLQLWVAQNGQLSRIFSARTQTESSNVFAANLHSLFSGTASGNIEVWDLLNGRPLRALTGQQGSVQIALSPAGDRLASASLDHTIKLWDATTGRELRTLIGHQDNVYSVDFSPDGRRLVSSSFDYTVRMWDAESGQELYKIDLHSLGPPAIKGSNDQIAAVRFSPDGKMLACSTQRSSIKIYDVATGSELRTLVGHSNDVEALAFSPQGGILASGSYDHSIKLWDVATGRELRTLSGHLGSVSALAFSPDGGWLFSGSYDNDIKVWDIRDGTLMRTLTGHTSQIYSLAISRDGRWLVSASGDGTSRIWEAATGELRAILSQPGNGRDWLVVSPDGLFDGSPTAWQQILWRFNGDTFDVAPVEVFFRDFYHPGLLADILDGKHPKAVADIGNVDRRQPVVKLLLASQPVSPTVTSRLVDVKLEFREAAPDQRHATASGVRDVRLFRNGLMVKTWHGKIQTDSQGTAVLETQLTLVAGENRLSAYAFSSSNIKSSDSTLTITGASSLYQTSTVHILAIGINQYENPDFNLRYSSADADDFALEIKAEQSELMGHPQTDVTELVDQQATKANVLEALKHLSAASKPEDVVFIYYGGHGAASGPHFYLLPYDVGYLGRLASIDASGLQKILDHGVSDMELAQAFEAIDAQEIVLVIDACQSGQILYSEDPRQGPMNSSGLAQLAYEKGMYILTAAQGYQQALEISQLGHGLLTYALIEKALKQNRASDDAGNIYLREWLDYAAQEVPKLDLEWIQGTLKTGVDGMRGGPLDSKDVSHIGLQRPRVFYRREQEAVPPIVGRRSEIPAAPSK